MHFEPKKRLTLSATDKKICGVCGGIAEYLGIDSTVVRVIYAFLTIFSAGFPAIILYTVLYFIIPNQ